MSVIYLIRHGQASFSAQDYDQLSDHGILQSQLLGETIKQKIQPGSHIISGTMLRHKQTMQHSLSALDNHQALQGLALEDCRWNEYDHKNILAVYNAALATPQGIKQYLIEQGKPFSYVKELFIHAIRQWTLASTSAQYTESFEEFYQRVLAGLTQVAKLNNDKTTVIYTSGGPISIVVCHLMGIPLHHFLDVNWNLVNGGITKLITRGPQQKLAVSTLNEHDFFAQQQDKTFITYT